MGTQRDNADETGTDRTTETTGTARTTGTTGTTGPPEASAGQGGGGAKKGLKSVRDMVLSMAVIGLGAFGLYATLPNDESKDPVREISYDAELATASRAAPYELVAPQELSDKWRATSVSYRANSDHGAVWHLGFMDPSDEYAAVEQGNGDERKFLSKVTHGASETGKTDTVNGREWVRYEGEKYNALVLKSDAGKSDTGKSGSGKGDSGSGDAQDGPVTTVVTGTASHAALKELAAALEPPQLGGEG